MGRVYDHLMAKTPVRRGNTLSSAFYRGYDHPDEPCPPRLATPGSQTSQAWHAGRDTKKAEKRPARQVATHMEREIVGDGGLPELDRLVDRFTESRKARAARLAMRVIDADTAAVYRRALGMVG